MRGGLSSGDIGRLDQLDAQGETKNHLVDINQINQLVEVRETQDWLLNNSLADSRNVSSDLPGFRFEDPRELPGTKY